MTMTASESQEEATQLQNMPSASPKGETLIEQHDRNESSTTNERLHTLEDLTQTLPLSNTIPEVHHVDSSLDSPSSLLTQNPLSSTPLTIPDPKTVTSSPRHLRLQSQSTSLEAQIASTQAQLTTTLARLHKILPLSSSTTHPPKPAANPESVITNAPAPTPTDETEAVDQVETLGQARIIVRQHMALLHRYNEIKDIGMGLMGLIAENNGRRLGDVMGDFGIEDRD